MGHGCGSQRASQGRLRDWSIHAPQPLKDRSLHTAECIHNEIVNKNFAFQPGVSSEEEVCSVSTCEKLHNGCDADACLPYMLVWVSNAVIITHYERDCRC